MADLLQRLQEMYASGKRLSTSKKYAKLYNQYKGGGGDTGLITGGVGYSNADKIAAEQEAKTSDFLSRYNAAIAGQPTIQDIYGRISGELGLPQANQLYTGLSNRALTIEGQLEELPEQIAGETRGYDVNAIQRNKIEAARGAKITDDLTSVARAAQRAGTTATNLGQQAMTQLGLEAGQLEKELSPFMTEAELLSDNLARQVTLYTTERQAQLETYLTKLRIQGELDAREMSNLAALAEQENEYELQKKLLSYKIDLGITKTGSGGSGDDGW